MKNIVKIILLQLALHEVINWVIISFFNLHVQSIVGVILHVVIALLALTEMVAAIVGSAFCCHGVCCTSNQIDQVFVSNTNEEFIILKHIEQGYRLVDDLF